MPNLPIVRQETRGATRAREGRGVPEDLLQLVRDPGAAAYTILLRGSPARFHLPRPLEPLPPSVSVRSSGVVR